MRKQYTFVLNFGYVESTRLSYLPFISNNKYADAKEALLDLAQFLKEHYLKANSSPSRKCCDASKKKLPLEPFCSKCGKALKEEEFDDEHFIDWLREMNDCDVDTFHADFIDYDTSNRWQTDGLEGGPNQRFVYEAEWVIAAALGYPHKKELTFEVLCKNRTRTKSDSFTYF